MVNLSLINKILKLQRSLLAYNAFNSTVTAAYSSSLPLPIVTSKLCSKSILQNTVLSMQLRPLSPYYYRSTFYNMSSSQSAAAAASSSSSDTIDEFRAREEKREEEFAREQEADEEKTKDEAEENAKRAKIDATRIEILEAALCHVPTLGWSRKTIIQGAEDAGFPSVVHGMFPEGGFALVSYFYAKCNKELVHRLKDETNNGKNEICNPLEFLVNAVRMRLEMIIPYKKQWPQALALIALPNNASTALAQVLTLVDDICYYSGDRSVDFNWYTRRVGLATIMKMTELYMLQDTSPNHCNTWEFLNNRMDEAVQLQMMLAQTESVTHNFQRSFNSAFITARNILGLNYDRR